MARSLHRILVLAAILPLLGFACDSGTTIPEDGATTCQNDDECPVGQRCVQGICTTPGDDDGAILCGAGGTCPDGLVCVDGFCVEGEDGGDGGDGGEELPAGPDIEILEPAATGEPPTHVLDFGSVMVGQPISRVIRVGNLGTEDLRISQLSFENGTAADFALDPATIAALPIVIAAGGESTLDVIYTATDGFDDFGVLDIVSNDPDEALARIQLRSEFKGEADIASDPAAVAFGDVTLGNTARVHLTLSNTGTGNAVLTIDAVQLVSVASPVYQLEGLPSLPVYLNRGDTLELDVAFTPDAADQDVDTLIVVSDDPDEPQLELPVTGRGVQPDLVVEPAPILFDLVRVGSGATLEIGVANQGLAPMDITGVRLVGTSAEYVLTSDPATGFDLASLSEANPQALAPGERRVLGLAFTPVDEGLEEGDLEVTSPDVTPSPRVVHIRGEGFIPPAIGVSPPQLTFGDVHIRGSRSLDLTVTNEGSGFLEVPSLAIQGGQGTFAVVPTSLPNLAAGDQGVARVTFSPVSISERSANLQISSNDPDNPLVDVPLLGSGIDPNIWVQPYPEVQMGSVYRGQSLEATVSVSNVGTGPLEVQRIELNAGSSPDFSLLDVPTLPLILASSSDLLQFRVLYAPEVVGQDSAAVRIESSDLDAVVRLVTVQAEAVGCPSGWWDVDADPANGCEYACVLTHNGVEACDTIDNDCDNEVDEDFDLTSDPQHCGVCNNACTYLNAEGLCVDSGCQLGDCAGNYWNADGDPANGCEYACVQSNNGLEACDSLDNDCDDEVDEDFDLTGDEANCGACHNVCDLFQASSECIESTCRIVSCLAPFDDCDGLDVNGCERNLMSDPENCNGCGNICHFNNAPALCVNGVCERGECSATFLDCDGDPANGCEVNTLIDEMNCGGCDMPCGDPAEVCNNGICQCGSLGPDCNALQLCCGIECIDPLADEQHCGDCSTACQEGESCETGLCSCGGSGADCTAAEICCGTECFDPLTTVEHCGECDIACDPNEQCLNGACRCGGGSFDCDLPMACCGTSCVDLTSDEANCGGCGLPCALDHASEHCTATGCVLDSCELGYGDCDGITATGCEENIWQLNSCGTSCATLVDCASQVENATGTRCASGLCDYSACNSGFGNCDNDRTDGCEQPLNTMDHCAACNTACSLPNATESCASGTCQVIACDPGWGDCTTAPGCETNIDIDELHCGTCATVCTAANGTNECLSGVCTPICNQGYGDCDASRPNGCEANLWLVNSCGNDCLSRVNCTTTVAHAGGVICSFGTCDYGNCSAGYGDCDGIRSNGCEAVLGTDELNCGSCGTICSNAHGTTECISGACAPVCSDGWADCDASRPNGCETNIWQLTSCSTTCTGAKNCATQVLNATDVACASGTCDYVSCNPGFDDCDLNRTNGCEVDLNTDEAHCGNCATVCLQAGGTNMCTSGTCVPSCSEGFGDCDTSRPNGCETDVYTDESHCGNCSTVCVPAGGSNTCTAGACVPSCSPGYGDCDTSRPNGCETDLNSDEAHCGDCATVCLQAGGTNTCTAGVCVPACAAGYGDCDTSRPNGCESDLNTDEAHCGNCATVCLQAGGTNTCTVGVCVPSCAAGYGDCDASRPNGCESDLNTDESHCGNCATVCLQAGGTNTCTSGVCVPSCAAGYGDCDGNPANGCETDLNSDEAHCGDCATVCLQAGGTNTCTAGVCVPSCSAGYGDCDTSRPNGCETHLFDTSACRASCGAAPANCNATVQHVIGVTCNGTCGYTSCASGWGDCDGNPANGCEAYLPTDNGNCGACGTVCLQNNGTNTCIAGTCVPSCDPGYGDCDSSRPNGCEENLWTPSACGNSCAGRFNCTSLVQNAVGAFCNAGACDYASCLSGFGDCDTIRTNGCEVNTNTNLANCGACANACSNQHGTTECLSGVCTPSCESGWDTCDFDPDNGCETDLTSDVNHCNGCGNACNLANANEACSSGVCVIASCVMSYWNIDGLDGTGCECADTSDVGDTCANSPYNVGTIGPGSMIVDRPGVLVHKTTYREDQDCYVVAYSQPAPGTGTLQVTFSPDPGNLRLDVWRNNCSTPECTNSVAPFQTTCYSLPGGGYTCQTGNSNTFYVCVKPANPAVSYCQNYTIRFQRY